MAFLKPPATCPVCSGGDTTENPRLQNNRDKEGKQFSFVRDFSKDNQEYSLYECLMCRVQFWLPQEIVGNVWYEHNNPYQVRSLAKLKISRGYHKKFLKDNTHFPVNTKFLDLGCGTGEFLAELEKRGCEVFGTDFDRDAIETAKNQLGLKNVYSLSFEDFFKKQDLPKFDIITAFEVIEHITDPVAFMGSVKGLLKEGGRVIFSTPYRERMLPNLNNWDFPPHHFLRWNQESISNISSRVGLNVCDVAYAEEFKILSEAASGKFATGLVATMLKKPRASKTSVIVPRLAYLIGDIKSVLFGKIPACALFLISKITNRKNGIIMVELKSAEDPKKVFLLAHSLDIGGMEKVISDLSSNIPNSIEVTTVFLVNKASHPYGVKGKIISLNLPQKSILPWDLYYFLVGVIRLRRLVKKEKPDYVMSFGFHANLTNVFSCKQSIVRADTYLSNAHGRMGRFLIKHVYRKARWIVCVSLGVAKDLVDNFKIKPAQIKTIYNFLNVKEVVSLASKPLESQYEHIFNSPVVITAGRLEKQKGQQYLIGAFKELKKEIPDAKLVILGSGNLEGELKRQAIGLGLEHDVHFLGWQKNPFTFLVKSKVFVSSSLREGLPGAILEAMACGLPVISTDCKSGPREILAPGTDITKEAVNVEYGEYGILTPVSNSKNFLKDAMVKVLTGKKLAEELQKKSLQRARDFDVSHLIRKWDFLHD